MSRESNPGEHRAAGVHRAYLANSLWKARAHARQRALFDHLVATVRRCPGRDPASHHHPARTAARVAARGPARRRQRIDLTRAFPIAGADAVLATRWKVPATEETRLFLVDFYEVLRQGGPGGTPIRKDEALTEARRRSRQRNDNAQLWAAWVLVRDAR